MGYECVGWSLSCSYRSGGKISGSVRSGLVVDGSHRHGPCGGERRVVGRGPRGLIPVANRVCPARFFLSSCCNEGRVLCRPLWLRCRDCGADQAGQAALTTRGVPSFYRVTPYLLRGNFTRNFGSPGDHPLVFLSAASRGRRSSVSGMSCDADVR